MSLRIAWLTPYGEDKLWDPALRLRRWNVHNELLRLGIDSRFLWNALAFSDSELLLALRNTDVVVFTEQSEREYNLMRTLSSQGKVLVRDHCENLFGFEWEKETFQAADLLVCCSNALASATTQHQYKDAAGIQVIPDMWEPAPISSVCDSREGLVAVFMGTGLPIQMMLGEHGQAARAAGYTVKMITSTPGVGIPWSADTWASEFSRADICLCPQDRSQFPCKSNVRVAQALACGLPTIASGLESYQRALGLGTAGIIAHDLQGWKEGLERMKDPSVRYRFHSEALKASSLYAPEAIARQWYAAFVSAYGAGHSI